MFMLAMICLIGIGCQWLAWWMKLPAILFLLIAGITLGPVTGTLDPDSLFGTLLFPIISLSVALILFEGGLTLRLHEMKSVGHVVRNLITIGAVITWLIITTGTHYFLKFSWELSFLFGALVVVTGPTVIIPMLRTVRPKAKLANILRWEGILIDPLGALLAVLVFNFIVSGRQSDPIQTFATVVVVGGAMGMVGAAVLGIVLRRHLMPEYLHNVAALSFVLAVYTIANSLAHEAGLLAVTLMGMILANMKNTPIDGILDFKESLSVLLISILFIVLAARVDFNDFALLGWGSLGVLAVIILIARPLSVIASCVGSDVTWREQALLAWIAPRGIVAAAVSALFALRLDESGEVEAQLLIPLTFLVIIVTVVLQSITTRPIAGWLKLADPEPRGVLIVGAHAVARAIATELCKYNYRVLLADTSWGDIRAARMAGLQTYFGNIVSEHADRHLDLVGIGSLLAMSPRPALNVLACQRYRAEFGGNKVFCIQTAEEKEATEKLNITGEMTGPRLFGEHITDTLLADLLANGGEVHSTRLSDTHDYAAYKAYYDDEVIPLFVLDEKGRLKIFTDKSEIKPEPQWTIISLIPADKLDGDPVEHTKPAMA